MDTSRRKLIIITASIILHAVTLFVVFVIYHTPNHDLFADFDPSKAIDVTETIFYDPSDANTPSISQPEHSVFDDWGQLKPRASTLGASMEMPDGPIGVEIPGDTNGTEDGDSDGEENSGDAPQTEAANENSLEFSPKINFDNEDNFSTPSTTSLSLPAEATYFDTLSMNGKSEGWEANGVGMSSDAKKKPASAIPSHPEEHASASRRKARKALAGITRGYLQQLQDEGENLIKTIGGDPNKKPTAEQLKYERYLAKIQWCLQNAHNINQEKCPIREQVDAAMRIYFVLNREGQMTGFKIMQSSGKAYVDQYITALFQFASSSFPPLPAYIKEDHLPLTYTVMVNWNTGSHTGFSRY